LSKDTFVSSARNMLKGKVIDIVNVDDCSAIVIADIGIPIKSLITTKSLNEMNIKKDSEIYVVFKTLSVTVYK
jgi:molybdopterin-binding protein